MRNFILVIDIMISMPFLVIGFIARFICASIVGGWRVCVIYSNWISK